ncbi:hypothetical protein Lyticum_00666 [Lyticum sinuosum]|uniref:Uncharacterized protein n=1 Tax=Lyticum sinuosum TaxID=1332059 RepID=A0AAE4VK68_9RICK|nr:hypothetical protein [Lyticum sinuosum]
MIKKEEIVLKFLENISKSGIYLNILLYSSTFTDYTNTNIIYFVFKNFVFKI